MSDNNFGWGPEEPIDDKEAEDALRHVISAGKARNRRRNAAVSSALALLLIVGVGTGVVISGTKTKSPAVQTQVVAAQSEAPVTAVSVATTSTTAPAAIARPLEIVASENDNANNGKLVVLNSSSGKVLRTLATASNRIGQVVVTHDGKTAYYVNYDSQTSPGGTIYTVPVAGGTAKAVGNGEYSGYVELALNADDTKLALVQVGNDISTELVVLNIASGKTQEVANNTKDSDSGGNYLLAGGVAWLDSSHLVANVSSANADNHANEGLYSFAVGNSPIDFNQGTAIAVTGAKTGTYYDSVHALSNGNLFVVQQCCSALVAATAKPGAIAMNIVNPKTGAVLQTIATGFLDRTYGGTTADESGTHLIYMSNDDLRISDDGSNPTVLVSGITSAAWA